MANEQNVSDDMGWHSEGELMGLDTVLTQFATKTPQDEGFLKGPRVRKFTEVV